MSCTVCVSFVSCDTRYSISIPDLTVFIIAVFIVVVPGAATAVPPVVAIAVTSVVAADVVSADVIVLIVTDEKKIQPEMSLAFSLFSHLLV